MFNNVGILRFETVRVRARMKLALRAAVLLATTPVVAQVHLVVTTDKPEYLRGEPIIVVLEVQNESSAPVGYPSEVSIVIPGVQQRVAPNISGCFGGIGWGNGTGSGDHEPTIKPGETQTFKYVVRGYDLAPGTYELTLAGTSGVRWSDNVSTESTAAGSQSNRFNWNHRLVVREGDEARLQEAMARLVATAQGTGQDAAIAKEAIIEAAPPFLESEIVKLASDVQLRSRAVAALGRMNTQASRASLRSLFDSKTDAGSGHDIVLALARTGEPDNLEFFSRLLRDTAESDPWLADYAALGAGFVGGPGGVEALRAGTSISSPLVRDTVAVALGNTKSADAVDVLIAMPQDIRDLSAVCGGLTSLTHWTWCDSSGDLKTLQARWRRWWTQNRSSTRIFGHENCPSTTAALPLVR